jgi:hypothetical protein
MYRLSGQVHYIRKFIPADSIWIGRPYNRRMKNGSTETIRRFCIKKILKKDSRRVMDYKVPAGYLWFNISKNTSDKSIKEIIKLHKSSP